MGQWIDGNDGKARYYVPSDTPLSPMTIRFIATYGLNAYKQAVELTAVAIAIGDEEKTEMYGACARELLQAGFHKADIPREPTS
jgi:hypothetical protein